LLPLSLTAPAATDVTVNFTTRNGTATAPEDYTAQTGTVTIPKGQTETKLPVTIIDDSQAEPAETFTVSLSGAVGASIVSATGTVTIQDNDGPPGGAKLDPRSAQGEAENAGGRPETPANVATQQAHPLRGPAFQVHTSSPPGAGAQSQAQSQAQHQVQAQQQIQSQQQSVVQHAQSPVVQAQTVGQPQAAMSTEAQIQRKAQAERTGGGTTQTFLATSRAGTATAGPALGVGALLTLLMMAAVTPSKRRKHERVTAFNNKTVRCEVDPTRRRRSHMRKTRGC